MTLCHACRAPVDGPMLDHYRTCNALAEMFPIIRRRKSKSAARCIVDGCREKRLGQNSRCRKHYNEMCRMHQHKRNGITVNRYRV